MDILTHTLSGVAAGSVLISFSNKGFKQKLAIVTISAIGGAFPDIDAISLWSKFDAYFGRLFGLDHSGHEIYFSKLWYSHHAFFHSLFAGVLLGVILISFIFLFNRNSTYFAFVKSNILLPVAFITGFLMHLLGDMPTPSAVWGGVNMFWPLHVYTGGYGNIWWWNNYDIFLIIVTCIIVNFSVNVTGLYFRVNKKMVSLFVGVICFVFIVLQINNRWVDFNYTGYTKEFAKFELQSKQEQKRILGKRIYTLMEKLDNAIPFNF